MQLTFNGESQARQFARDFCALFDAGDLESLRGRSCFVLRCFDRFSETIEGIESESGRRITRTGWWRQHADPTWPSEIVRRQRSLDRDIARLEAQLSERRQERATLIDNYVEWTE